MLQLDSSDGLNADSFILSKMLATKLEELSTHLQRIKAYLLLYLELVKIFL